jgi:phosphoenolpyruvate carboxykinase (ATP)
MTVTVNTSGASRPSGEPRGGAEGAGVARPFEVRYIENPSQAELRKLALAHTPAVIQTRQGSLVKVSRNKNRVAQYTYVVAAGDEAKQYNLKPIDPAKARELIARQGEYIKQKGTLVAIDGYLGLGPRAVGVEWLYTLEGANIAGMQQCLAFPRSAVEGEAAARTPFAPTLRIVYTPDFFVDDMPGRQAIVVDLANWTTHVMGADYFGESKKGALRMLNEYVYRHGGLTLHAGAKAVHAGGRELTVTIMGESGTGKTTTTFSKQGEVTQPIQDDMVSLWPHGEMSVTENGCFAKTEGLTAKSEPTIYHASMDASAWLENIYVDRAAGEVDFLKGPLTPDEVRAYREVFVLTGSKAENVDKYISGAVPYDSVVDETTGVTKDGWDFVCWTQNGRSIVPMASIKEAADLSRIPAVKSMGILNRDEGPDAATPGVVRFTSPEQAAGFFMLGETSKTSAAGKDRGKMRSPFTQPFFPRNHGLQAGRFRELIATMPGVDVWMMNTGCVGGDAKDAKAGRAINIEIRHSSAMLEAALTGAIKWARDPDFGYEVVDVAAPENRALVAAVPAEVLVPRLFFERVGRGDEYRAWVAKMKKERREFLAKFNIEPAIIDATVGA